MNSNILKVGVGRQDITPPIGIKLMGYPVDSRPAESVHDELTATVLIFEYNRIKIALISLAIVVFDENEANEIKLLIAGETGIEPSNIIVCSFQTHSGPETLTLWGWSSKNEEYCAQIMRPSILKAVIEAEKNKKTVHIGIGTVWSDVGVNRRQIMEDGRVTLGSNPWGPFDPTMTVIRFMAEEGPVANIIHYGAHPTSAGSTREITRDWPGIMIDRLETVAGGITLFLNGAVGDVGPRLSCGETTGGNIKYVEEVGNRAAFDAVKAFRTIKEYRGLDIEAIKDRIYMPYRPSVGIEEAKMKLDAAEKNIKNIGLEKAEYMFWKYLVEEYENGGPKSGRYIDQTIIRLGPVVFVPFPGEPFAEIVLRIRELSPYKHTLCISTCNGSLGYFATRESLHRGGYEVEVAKAFMPYVFAENIDDILVKENIRILRDMEKRYNKNGELLSNME